MTIRRFDGFDEIFLSDYCIDENGRWVLREDAEAAEECRRAYHEERRRRQAIIDGLTYLALGMLVSLSLFLLGNG